MMICKAVLEFYFFNSGRFLWNYEIEKSFSPCTLLHNCFLFVWCVFFSPWGNLNFSSPFYLELLLFSLFICFEILIAFSFSTTFFLSALPHALLFCSCYSFFRHVWFIMHSSANVISTSIHLQINSHICKAHSVNPHTAGLCSSSSVYSAFFFKWTLDRTRWKSVCSQSVQCVSTSDDVFFSQAKWRR